MARRERKRSAAIYTQEWGASREYIMLALWRDGNNLWRGEVFLNGASLQCFAMSERAKAIDYAFDIAATAIHERDL